MKKPVKRQKKTLVTKIFLLKLFPRNMFLNLIKDFPGNKGTVSNDIPVSILKESIFV